MTAHEDRVQRIMDDIASGLIANGTNRADAVNALLTLFVRVGLTILINEPELAEHNQAGLLAGLAKAKAHIEQHRVDAVDKTAWN
jgi:hypothetical protein